jgi:hypothetical protein
LIPYKKQPKKTPILSITVAVFALAVQAGNEKACSDKGNSSCCASVKAEQTKAENPASKSAKAPYTAKSASKEAASKRPLQSPKAFADAR